MGLFRGLRRGATFAAVGLAGGALVVTARHILETPQPLESALPAEARIDRKHGGDIYYNVAGPEDAEPLVLLHDFYPGASNFGFRPVFSTLARRYRVYAPDWLGFGMSEHPHVAYTGEFYAGLLTGFLSDVVARPAIVVAHGHAANIAVRAASDTPALFERLVLVAPSVLADRQQDPTFSQALVRATQRFMLGLVPYALLSTRPALRWTATSRSARAQDSGADSETVDRLYASAHQFGGQHALLALLTGELDLPMRNAFALLEPPVLIVAGRQDQQHPRADMEDLAVLNPHADLRLVQGAADAVYEDRPDGFVATLTEWLDTPASRHALDESALLPPEPAAQATTAARPEEAAGESRIRGGIEHPEEASAELPSTPTEGPVTPDAEEASGDETITGDAMVGEPGAVVPGVSDMGLEGANTPDVGVTGTMRDEITLGPAGAVPDKGTGPSDSPSALLPEAGSAGSSSREEQEARAGEEPPLAPASNIGHEPEPASGTENADIAGSGDVQGLAHTVQTPDTALATTDEAVRTPSQAVDTPEMLEGNVAAGDEDVAAKANRQTQRSTRAGLRQPGAKSAPASASATGGSRRGKAVGGKPSDAKGGPASRRASRKRPTPKSKS